jgi:bacterioferritin-associated ferredoxin
MKELKGERNKTETANCCPSCLYEGKDVDYITVQHMVRKVSQAAALARYYICMNPNCEIVYFDQQGLTILKHELKVPVWFKETNEPRIVCYCANVTDSQIKKAIVTKGAQDLKDIKQLTGAMTGCNCKETNPVGKCCGPVIQDIINSELKKLKKTQLKPEDQGGNVKQCKSEGG